METSNKHSLKVTFVFLDKEENAVGEPTEYTLDYGTCQVTESREISRVFDLLGCSTSQVGKTVLTLEGVVRVQKS